MVGVGGLSARVALRRRVGSSVAGDGRLSTCRGKEGGEVSADVLIYKQKHIKSNTDKQQKLLLLHVHLLAAPSVLSVRSRVSILF